MSKKIGYLRSYSDKKIKLEIEIKLFKLRFSRSDNGDYVYDSKFNGNMESIKKLLEEMFRYDSKRTTIDLGCGHMYCDADLYNLDMLSQKMSDSISKLKEINKNSVIPVIYDEFIDKDGKLYGKELITGLVFPIIQNDNNFNVNFNGKRVCYDDCPESVKFNIFIKYDIDNYRGNFSAITYSRDANDKDIKDYLCRYNKLFEKIKLYIELYLSYRENNINNDINYSDIISDCDTGIKIDDKIKLISDIRLLILNIGDNNIKEEYLNKLNSILEDSSVNINDGDIINLLKLKSRIEIRLIFLKKNASNIFECLDTYKAEYNECIGTDKKAKITLEEINKFFEMFNSVKDNYSILDQEKILNDFGYIYLMELYKNKCKINSNDEKYIKLLLDFIIININLEIDKGTFCNNLELILRNITCLEDLLDIIKSLELNKESFKKRVRELEVQYK